MEDTLTHDAVACTDSSLGSTDSVALCGIGLGVRDFGEELFWDLSGA